MGGEHDRYIDLRDFEESEITDDIQARAFDVEAAGRYVLVLLSLHPMRHYIAHTPTVTVYDTMRAEFVDQDPDQDGLQVIVLPAPAAVTKLVPTPDGRWAVGLDSDDEFDAGTGRVIRLSMNERGLVSIGETLLGEEELGGELVGLEIVDSERGVAVIKIQNENEFNPDYL